jgi:hypothetical protein
MSLLTTCECKIGANINQELLKRAVDFVAKKNNGKTTSNVMGQKVIAGFAGGRLRYGIGVRQSKNGLEFVYDSEDSHLVSQIKKEIETTYKKMALIKAATNMGFEVEVEKVTDNIIKIKGRKE